MLPQGAWAIKDIIGLMSSRSTTLAIALGLAVFLCVCMMFLIGVGGLAFYGVTRGQASTLRPIAATSAPLATQTADDMNAIMSEIEQQVKELRGWQSSKAVPRNFYNQDQIREYNLKLFEEDYSPEEARDDALSLAAFGLLDPSFDLYNFYIDLYSENILGMYDHEADELFIITERGAMGAVERGTFAHEYQHALQDAKYDLEALGWTDEAFDADAQKFGALQAFIEGEAMLLESQWEGQYFTTADWDDFNANAYADPDSAYFRAPEWLQRDFYFPYDQGWQFINALYERGGWAEVDAAYDHLPISTEMILHLDKYDDYEQPDSVPAPPLAETLGSGWREIDTNSNGEWYTYLILDHFIDEPEAVEAAAGWGGDRYTVAYNDSTGQTVAAWHLTWDTNGDLEEFVDAFQKYGDERFGVAATIGDGRLCWDTADVDSCLYFTPEATLWILAPDFETLEKVKQATDL